MKKFLIYFTTAALIFSFAGCSMIPSKTKSNKSSKHEREKDDDDDEDEDDDDKKNKKDKDNPEESESEETTVAETETTEFTKPTKPQKPEKPSKTDVTETETSETEPSEIEVTESTEVTETIKETEETTVETTKETTAETANETTVETTKETETTVAHSGNDVVIKKDTYEFNGIDIDSYYDSYRLNDGNFFIDTRIDEFAPYDCSDELADALLDLNSVFNDNIDDFYDLSYDVSYYVDKDEYYFYTKSISQDIKRSDDQVFSSLTGFFTYESLNEVYTNEYVGINIDPTTGNTIELSSIINEKNEAEFKSYLENDLSMTLTDYDKINSAIENRELNYFQYVINPNGITIIFNEGEVAEMEDGFQTVFISYYLNPEFFKVDLWSKYPGNKILEFQNYGNYDAIVLEDMSTIILEYGEEDYWYSGVTITGPETSASMDFYGYSHDAYYIECNGKKFIYIKAAVENDYDSIEIYDITNSKNYEYVGYDFCDIKNFVNPENFTIYKTIQKISTSTGYQNAKVGSNGEISYIQNEFMIASTRTFRTLAEIPAYTGLDVYDSNTDPADIITSFTDSCTIPANTTLLYLATDDYSYVVFYDLDNGGYYYVESEDYDDVGGLSIYDVFNNEDIMFAG